MSEISTQTYNNNIINYKLPVLFKSKTKASTSTTKFKEL